MSDPTDPLPPPQISKEKLASLPPEDQRRILTAMRFLVDVKALYLDGMRIASDMLEGKTPGTEVGMRLMEFERDLRLAGNELTKRPLRVVHADALRKGETKLDEDPWLMRTRIRTSEARKAREEQARNERFQASMAPREQSAPEAEPESESGPGMRP